MARPTGATDGVEVGGDAAAGPSPVVLFALLWDALADLLGTAGAAALLRRAASRVPPGSSGFVDFAIVRENLEYRYELPPAWSDSSSGAERTLRLLVDELLPLLAELTGPVVIRRIAQIPELVTRGIIPKMEGAP
jgi:hypothetical protein